MHSRRARDLPHIDFASTVFGQRLKGRVQNIFTDPSRSTAGPSLYLHFIHLTTLIARLLR